ncbi:MAG: hypothetical protein NTV32_03480 [Gammaproteobacteria bacterium]|nr:hypothetical protein [Gammaproteobacteria bacterium]
MNATIRKINGSTSTDLVILFQTEYGAQRLEISKTGWCDLNDLDCFCRALFPAHELGSLSADKLVRLAKKIYQIYSREDLISLQSALSKKMSSLLFFKQSVSGRILRTLESQQSVAA